MGIFDKEAVETLLNSRVARRSVVFGGVAASLAAVGCAPLRQEQEKPVEIPAESPKPAEAPAPAGLRLDSPELQQAIANAVVKAKVDAKAEVLGSEQLKKMINDAKAQAKAEANDELLRSEQFKNAVDAQVETQRKLKRISEGLWQSQDEFTAPLEKPIGNPEMWTTFQAWYGVREEVYHVLVAPNAVVRMMPIETVKPEYKGTNVMWVGAEWEVDTEKDVVVKAVEKGHEQVLKRDRLQKTPPKKVWVGPLGDMPQGFTAELPAGWYAQTFEGGYLEGYPYPPFMLDWFNDATPVIVDNKDFSWVLPQFYAAFIEVWDGRDPKTATFVVLGMGNNVTIPGYSKGNMRYIQKVTDDRMLITRAGEMAQEMAKNAKLEGVKKIWIGAGDPPKGWEKAPDNWKFNAEVVKNQKIAGELKWKDDAKGEIVSSNTLKASEGEAYQIAQVWDGSNVGSSVEVVIEKGKAVVIPFNAKGTKWEVSGGNKDQVAQHAVWMAEDKQKNDKATQRVKIYWAGAGDPPAGLENLPDSWKVQ